MTAISPEWIAKATEARALAGVAPADASRLFANATVTHVRNEEAIFGRGETAHSVYVALAGAVRISTLAESGKRIVVEIFGEREMFGEIAAIDEGVRTADAMAMGPGAVLAIPAGVFRVVLAGSAPLANNLLRLATARLRRTYSLLEDASLRSIEIRLARQVLYLIKLGTSGRGQLRLQTRMHQDELADLLGITTRSIINVLNKWRAEDLVAFDGRTAQLTILDITRFQRLVDE
jgi:CRP-like cAMP-binding protein